MGRFVEGYKEISVNLIDFKGDDLARAACKFGALGEFYEGADKLPYDPNHPHFQKVVKASFGWRRKTLYNCLQLGLGLNKEVAQKVIADLNLGENVRGEQLSIPQFILLSQIIKNLK